MKAAFIITAVIIIGLCILFSAVVANAQLRLSVASPGLHPQDPLRPLATYDETVDVGLELRLSDLWVEQSPPTYVMRVLTSQHYQNGFPSFPDTEGGAWYFCLAWLDPGGVFVNFSAGQSGQWLWIVDDMWQGRLPSDYTTLSVKLMDASGACAPAGGTMRSYEIPITWITDPVPTANTTWGGVKSMYGGAP